MKQPQPAPVNTSYKSAPRKGVSTARKGNGPTSAEDMTQEAPREEIIRRMAYACYEARGRTDGHDLDDWLTAEAQLTQTVSKPVKTAAIASH